MKVVFILGPPGCGKGTQSSLLSERLGIPHISTGDCLREEIAAGTELGKKIETPFHGGELMEPQDMIRQDMIRVVQNRLSKPDCGNGAIIDGGARTVEEACHYMNAGILTDMIWMNAGDRMCLDRMRGRVVDPVTNRAYHLVYDPPPAEIESRCERRKMDDKAEDRLETYHRLTKPVFGVVRDHPDARLHTIMIDSEWDVEDTYSRVLPIVEGVLHCRVRLVGG